MSDTKAEEIISLLYAILGVIVMEQGHFKWGFFLMGYAATNMIYVIWLAIKAHQRRGE
jgi:hypothetical protein